MLVILVIRVALCIEGGGVSVGVSVHNAVRVFVGLFHPVAPSLLRDSASEEGPVLH